MLNIFLVYKKLHIYSVSSKYTDWDLQVDENVVKQTVKYSTRFNYGVREKVEIHRKQHKQQHSLLLICPTIEKYNIHHRKYSTHTNKMYADFSFNKKSNHLTNRKKNNVPYKSNKTILPKSTGINYKDPSNIMSYMENTNTNTKKYQFADLVKMLNSNVKNS